MLETVFQTSKYIVRNKRQQMSAELNLTERQIKIWFQNRRMKEKKCGHKDAGGRADGPAGCPATTAATGYADDYAGVGPAYPDNRRPAHGRHDVFADYDDRLPASKHPLDDGGPAAGYAGGGGYDLSELDQYGVVCTTKQQWSPVEFRQDYYDDVVSIRHHRRNNITAEGKSPVNIVYARIPEHRRGSRNGYRRGLPACDYTKSRTHTIVPKIFPPLISGSDLPIWNIQ